VVQFSGEGQVHQKESGLIFSPGRQPADTGGGAPYFKIKYVITELINTIGTMKIHPMVNVFITCIFMVSDVVSGGMHINDGLILPISNKSIKNESNSKSSSINIDVPVIICQNVDFLLNVNI
jgi:hypothetical protein